MNQVPPLPKIEQPSDLPDVIKAFVDQSSPPPGQGNDFMVWDWKIVLTLLIYLPYALVLWKHVAVHWILLAYSGIAIIFFALMIRGFKMHMAYQSNPFDFVRVQLILLFHVVILFGMAHWSLSSADHTQYSRPLDAFTGVYFSFVTMATLGYGDISPTHVASQLIVMAEITCGIWFFVTIVPVAVADQAERIRHYRAKRKVFAEATEAAWKRGQLKPVQPPSTEA